MNRTECVVVERSFDERTEFDVLQKAEDEVAWCLEQHGVRFIRSYLAIDGRSMICLYAARDAESVRETQRKGGLAFTRAWASTVLAVTDARAASPGRSTVVVERDLPEGLAEADLLKMIGESGPCFATNEVELLASHCSFDFRRVVCVFAAPDAEAVRRANRQSGVPFTRVWSATHHEP